MSAITISCGIAVSRLSEVAVLAVALPQTLPEVVGPGMEVADLSAPASDTWTLDGASATVTTREYRLLLDGVVAQGPQASPTFTLPAGTAGQTYSYQLRVVVAPAAGSFSAWTELGSGVVSYAPPQVLSALPDLSLTTGSPDQVFDFVDYFSGSDLTYTVPSGPLPSGSTLIGSVLNLAAIEPYGPGPLVIRATNPGGTIDQPFNVTITAAATAPGPFQPGDWTVTAPALAGVIEVAVSALPSDGGAALAALEYRLDGGSFVALGGTTTGIYQIAHLNLGQTYLVEMRAVNGIDAGPASDTKSETTANVPAPFTSGQWAVADAGTGDDIRIAIAALPDAAGAPLTRLQYNIDAAGWVDFPAAPAIGTFDIFNVVTSGHTSQVLIRANNAIGNAGVSDTKSVTPTSGFDLTSTPDREIEIDQAQGVIAITVTSPDYYATYDAGNGPGVFTADVANLTSGPVNLVPPKITSLVDADTSSTITQGDTLGLAGTPDINSYPGLWIYGGANGEPFITQQWQSDVAGNTTYSNISGATSTSYLLTSDENGDNVRLVETATDGAGSRSANSVAIPVEAPVVSTAATYLGEQELLPDSSPNPTTQVDVSGFNAGEKLIIFHGCARDSVNCTVNGNDAGAPNMTWNYGSERRGSVYTYVLQASDITAGLVDVTVNLTASRGRNVIDVYHTVSGTVVDAVPGNWAYSITATTTNETNSIIHFACGVDTAFNGPEGLVYTSGPMSRLWNLVDTNVSGAAGILYNAPVGANTWTWTKDGTGNHASVMVVVE